MQIIGIVTEYNPFHNGHLYQIKKIKEMYPDSVIIVAMSGNYTMRGEISVLDKWNKTKNFQNNIPRNSRPSNSPNITNHR